MAPHGKELSDDLKKRIVALHKDDVGYKKIAKTLKMSCSMVAKTIQRFNRTGSTQNRPRHGRPKKLSARAQHFQWPVWESESDNTKFNTPAPHSHLIPCNTNESHDTEERKWLIAPNLDIFT